MLTLIFNTIWLFLPAYTPNNFALVFGGGKPIDMGKNFFDGIRILGDGKTFRGFFGGLVGGTITGLVQYFIEPVLKINFFSGMDLSSALSLFLFLSLGSLSGDMVGSFIKRRLNIERGGKAPILDQLDFLIFAIIFASFHENFHRLYTSEIILAGIILTPLLHRLTNFIAYLLKLKDVPW